MSTTDGIQPTTATGGPESVVSRPDSPAGTIGTPDTLRGALDLDHIEATARNEDGRSWGSIDGPTAIALVKRLREAEVALEGRCLADITLRDDDHRMVICILREGHTSEHDDGMGCLWTDGGHGQHVGGAASAQLPVIDAARLELQRQWSLNTFGPGPRTLGVLDHIRRELDEVAADPTDLGEWVDVIILALDGAWRAGHEPQAILDAIAAKHDLNRERTWPDWRGRSQDEAIEHIRVGDDQ